MFVRGLANSAGDCDITKINNHMALQHLSSTQNSAQMFLQTLGNPANLHYSLRIAWPCRGSLMWALTKQMCIVYVYYRACTQQSGMHACKACMQACMHACMHACIISMRIQIVHLKH